MRIDFHSHWLSAALCLALPLPFVLAVCTASAKDGNVPAAKSAAASAGDSSQPQKYIGPGSCAATSCHGSVTPVEGSRILQNEYSTWITRDKHSRAYQALTGDIGERIARILKLSSKAEEAPKCLACHALYTTRSEERRVGKEW